MKKIIVIIGLVALMVAGATYAVAQDTGHGPGQGRMAGRNWGFEKGPSLTADQKVKFQELRRKFNDETAQLRGTLLTKRLEFRSLWSNPKADSKVIMEREMELRQVQGQLRDKAFQMRLEARSILTPDQLARIGKGRGAGPHSGRQFMTHRGGRMGYGHKGGWCDGR